MAVNVGEQEDVWISSACNDCFAYCAIRVHRVNGVVTKIEGNPADPLTQGRICARGLSAINTLYDPSRLNYPLKRTNPEKGIGIDPKWERISWDEALDTITEKLKKVRADNPKKLVAAIGVNQMNCSAGPPFVWAFGSPNVWVGGAGNHCGSGMHVIGGLTHAAWGANPDLNYCNYLIDFGRPAGGGGCYYGIGTNIRKMAEARARGMKLVVFDPWMGMGSAHFDEVHPIRPGTDAAVALAMMNLLLNEYGIYDHEYLAHDTNGPYLVREDGHYFRDAEGRPQIFDAADERMKPYDATIGEPSLEFDRTMEGQRIRSAFSILKEHVKTYTPEMAAEISDVPADTIRRIAKEFGEAASIGSTITIDGHELPYRPVAVYFSKGASCHKHSTLSVMAMDLLGQVVGQRAVPGSLVGFNTRNLGHPETGYPKWSPTVGPDGLVSPGAWLIPLGWPWPGFRPKQPDSLGLQELVPTSAGGAPWFPIVAQDPAKYGIDYKPEFCLMLASNILFSTVDHQVVEAFLKDVFTVNINIFLDESTELADIVLPDAMGLERTDIQADWRANGFPTDSWVYLLRQEVVPPSYERRSATEVLLELAERVGMLPDLYAVMNPTFELREPYALEPDQKYTFEEIVDRRHKSWFGDKFGLEWFKENGILTWPKKVEEVYWEPFVKARTPMYFEHLLTLREDIERIQAETGLFSDMDLEDFQPYPDWKPCPHHEETRPDFDLDCFYGKINFHAHTHTGNRAWLDELSAIDPPTNAINIYTETARKKGIQDGDWVELESGTNGKKVRGKARLTRAIRPDVVAVSGHGGHWAPGLPLACQPGKGVSFTALLDPGVDYVDGPSFNYDMCVRVKIAKVDGPYTEGRPGVSA